MYKIFKTGLISIFIVILIGCTQNGNGGNGGNTGNGGGQANNSTNIEFMKVVQTDADLPNCNNSNDGIMYYIIATNIVKYCLSGTYSVANFIPVCGNNSLETGEQCDDGNIVNGDGCDSTCHNENISFLCGNGTIDQGEQCDDSNLINGDACDDTCHYELDPFVVAIDKINLKIGYLQPDNDDNVTQDISLPTSGFMGSTVTWTSDNAAINVNGNVSRPVQGTGNSLVTLTATITKNTITDIKVFNLTVIETPQTDNEAVAADKSSLTIAYGGTDSAGSVTQNVTFSTTGLNGTTITWSSSDTGAIATNGAVTRPGFASGDAVVTLIATIDKNGINDTKIFNLTVIKSIAAVAGKQWANSVGGVAFNMVEVPGKTTFIGVTDAIRVSVANDYLIAETEVTYELWSAVKNWADSNGYTFANAGVMGDGTGDTNQHPVTTINWRDAMVWTNALTEYYNAQNATSLTIVYTSDADYTTPIRSSADGVFGATFDYPNAGSFDDPYVTPNATGFRLPTDVEWELAARYINDANGDGDIIDQTPIMEYYPGDHASGATADYTDVTATGLVSWYSVNSGSSTHVVATKTANALGLYDMSGNVSEWVFDWYTVNFSRVEHGGSWDNSVTNIQVGGSVFSVSSYNEYDRIGFRPARSAI
ncbi:MAG: immunoglobulin-like domain-containing protein [Leptospirales bacterium]